MTNLKQQLRQWYEQDLNKIVTRNNGRDGPRVRTPSVYERQPELSNPRQITPEDRVWVSSDLHFDHNNIIDFSDRPFATIETMNQTLIDNHNDYVGSDDIWICVGDVGFKGVELIRERVAELNGYKILVIGNHDVKKKRIPDYGFDEVYLIYYLDLPEAGLVFTHFPMFNLPRPLINVHGHLHRYFDLDSTQHINVCCEFHNFRPLSLDVLTKWASGRIQQFGLMEQTCLVCDNRHAHLRSINDQEVQCPFCQAVFNRQDVEE